MNILVTGGAGYIGSVLVEELTREGHRVVVLDNLSQGHRAAVHPEAALVVADLRHREAVEPAFLLHPIDAVMHLAAEVTVGASMTDPARYFEANVVGGFNLLEAMRRHGVERMVFSSSAAIYGEPRYLPIREEDPVGPINAMGESKAIFERFLSWYSRAYGLKFAALRYFNASGATQRCGEDHRPETHLIPLVLRAALNQEEPVSVWGHDYPTRDGTCIRDYIHVLDLARAHLLALEALQRGQGGIYNLGNGEGYSVREVIDTAREVTGQPVPYRLEPRRPGDPPVLIASAERARQELGWQPRFPVLRDIIASAWEWHRHHPRGYLD